MLKIKVKCGAKLVELEMNTEDNVLLLKQKIAENSDIPVEQQKLVHKGKVLKDEETLGSRSIADGATIFAVKGVAATKSTATGSTDDGSGNGASEPSKAATSSSSSSAAAANGSSDAKDAKEKSPLVSARCVTGCGFWATAEFNGYCSKCFQDKQKKEEEELKKAQEEAIKAEQKSRDAVSNSNNMDVDDGKDSNMGKDNNEDGEKERPVQEHKNRCWVCQKKIGLTGHECRCGYVFCSAHRLPEDHNCDFDYKSIGREILRKQNNKVEADKLGDRL